MSYRSQTFKVFHVNFRGVDLVLRGVTFYPGIPATQIDPPDAPFAEWDYVSIGGVEVRELFNGTLGEELQDEVVRQLEAA